MYYIKEGLGVEEDFYQIMGNYLTRFDKDLESSEYESVIPVEFNENETRRRSFDRSNVIQNLNQGRDELIEEKTVE